MNEPATAAEVAILRAELAAAKELTEVSLKAAISALAGLQALVDAVKMEQLLGEGHMPAQRLEQADAHVKKGWALLKEFIERPTNDRR